MAKVYTSPKIGDIVYIPYSPKQVGKVINVDTTTTPPQITIRLLNGTTIIKHDWAVNDFRALIADHQKKLQTHINTLARAEAIPLD